MTAPDFTLFDVLAWARTKPADDRYRYMDNDNCALCQFLRETGRAERPSVSGYFWRDADRDDPFEQRLFPDGRKGLEYALMAPTFGALVTRLEALCPGSEWVRVESYMAIGSATVATREPSLASRLGPPGECQLSQEVRND